MWINGQFKLCTCSEKIDKSKPYWVLKSNRQDDLEHRILGQFSKPNVLFTPIVRRNILRKLNSIKSVFDFDYTPKERDLLKLCGEYDEYYCEFKKGKWRWLENFQYLGKKGGEYRNKKRVILKVHNQHGTLDEYHTLTNTSLYRNDDFWF